LLADGGEDDVGSIALAALEMAAADVTVSLHVSEHGLDGAATSQRLMTAKRPEMKAWRGLAAR
jgi:hypothetical protein